MIAALTVLPLILVLWAVEWLAGFCGARLPKRSWKRLPLAILAIGVNLGIPALQIYLLTTLVSNRFAHEVFFYLLVAEYVPAIALVFIAGIREEQAKKRRELAGTQETSNAPASIVSGKK